MSKNTITIKISGKIPMPIPGAMDRERPVSFNIEIPLAPVAALIIAIGRGRSDFRRSEIFDTATKISGAQDDLDEKN